jgi:hypothetical protein
MTEPRLQAALRRLNEHAAEAALEEDSGRPQGEEFRVFLRRVIAEELQASGREATRELRVRLAEIERQLGEIGQVLRGFEVAEPPEPAAPPVPPAEAPTRLQPPARPAPRRAAGWALAALLLVVGLTGGLALFQPRVLPPALAEFRADLLGQLHRVIGGDDRATP